MNDCPPVDELQQMLDEQMTVEREQIVSAHVDTCATCLDTVDLLSAMPASWGEDLQYAREQTARELPPELARIALSPPTLCAADCHTGPYDAPGNGQAWIGQTIGRCELQRVLGSGGMGIVYEARHTVLERPVAVKMLLGDRAQDGQWTARFQAEMQAVGRLNHPNIVNALDAVSDGDTHYLVMEFVEGLNCEAMARSGHRVPVAEACEIVRLLAGALQYIHQQGLIHRDVKPSNVMLTRTGEIKLLDLGLARVLESIASAEPLTKAGQVVGTPAYMAPEQRSIGAVPASDIYALGCTLQKLLPSKVPVRVAALVAEMRDDNPDLRPSPQQVIDRLNPYTKKSDLPRFAKAVVAGKSPEPTPDASVWRRICETFWALIQPFLQRPCRTAWVGVGVISITLLLLTIIVKVTHRDGRVIATLSAPDDAVVQIKQAASDHDRPLSEKPAYQDPDIRDVNGRFEVGNPERQVALGALEVGGTIRFHGQTSRDANVTRASELPADAFRLLQVDLNSRSPVTDHQLAALKQLEDLQSLDLSATPVVDDQLKHIAEIKTLRWLYLARTTVSNHGLAHLHGLLRLETLSLSNSAVTDMGIASLPVFPAMNKLVLEDTNIGDAGLAAFDRFPKLQQLFLRSSMVSDEGLRHLRNTPRLTHLSLQETSITDRGLLHLKSLKELRQLDLQFTLTTRQGIDVLQAALPNCAIQWVASTPQAAWLHDPSSRPRLPSIPTTDK